MSRLKALSGGGEGDSDEESRILTAIAAYARVGAYHLPLAMAGLGAIAIARLAPIMDDSQRLARILERVETHMNADPGSRTQGLVVHHALLKDWARRLYDNTVESRLPLTTL